MTEYRTIKLSDVDALPRSGQTTQKNYIHIKDLLALFDKAPSVEPVKPEYCWDDGYEEESFIADVMQRHAKEHNKKAGDFLNVNYAITGKAKYRVLDDDNVEIYELTPAYFSSPPQTVELEAKLAEMQTELDKAKELLSGLSILIDIIATDKNGVKFENVQTRAGGMIYVKGCLNEIDAFLKG